MELKQVESVAAALVREYLSRRGLKKTLELLDEEEPRNDKSINNRNSLMKALHLEKLMKKNKDSESPLKSMLEVLAQYCMEKAPTITKNGDGTGSKSSSNISAQGRARLVQDKTANGGGDDLILEDTIEGETFLGDGKIGTVGKREDVTIERRARNFKTTAETVTPAATAGNQGKMRGMSGPILSNLDKIQRQRFTSKRQDSLKKDWLGEGKKEEKPSTVILPPSRVIDVDKPIERLEDRPLSGRSDSSLGSKSSSSEGDSKNKVLSVLDRDSWKPSSKKQAADDLDIPSYDVRKSSMSGSSSAERLSEKSCNSKARTPSPGGVGDAVGDVAVGDVEDDDLGPVLPPVKLIPPSIKGIPIDMTTATDLKKLILGSGDQCFAREWSGQSFTFCDLPNLKYGIVQKKGGPCGILAAVQACMLQNLLFTSGMRANKRLFNCTNSERSEALAKALSKIFWRAGHSSAAIICLPSRTKHISSTTWFKADNVTETLNLYTIRKFEDLVNFITQQVAQFEVDGTSGVILSLYSAILSRGIKVVQSDMDEPTSKLMGQHSYCSQNMVNLYLTGQAVSNVFNDTMELDSGGDSLTILKGIPCRSDIGFMSLFEHYKSCQVGTYYKTPKFPIWVVCSESHFSVFFCLRKDLISDWKAEKMFDLYYYDGLARQDAEIRLTINTCMKYTPPAEADLIPPLEHCIRTKWKGCVVEWNDTEPLL